MKQTATFDYKFPVDPGFGPQSHHDMDPLKYDTSSYEELFGDLHEVTPQPHDPSPGTKMQSIEDFQDLDVDLLGLVQGNHPNGGGHHSSNSNGGSGGMAYSNPTPANASVNSSNTNIMYPSTLPSPQLGTPMSQMSLTSQSISSSESLHHTPPMSMSVLSSHQQSPFQHQQLQQQVTQQLQHQQQHSQQHSQQQHQHQQLPHHHQQQPQPVPVPPQQQQPQMHQQPQPQMVPQQQQPAAAQARRQPWNMNMNMVSAPTPWGAWGLGGSAAAAAAAAALSQHNGVRVSHIPVSNNPAPRKKLSEHQLRVLEKVFNETPKPCLKTRTELERDLDLPKKNIQIWFQNRRAKEKQNIKKREGELANAAANSSASNANNPSSAVRQPHMAAAAAAAAINSDGPQPDSNSTSNPPMKPVMHIPNANGKQVPTTTRQRPGLSLQRTFSTTSQSSINNNNSNNNNNNNAPSTPVMGAPPKNPTTPVGLGGSTKHPSSTSLPALASTTNSDTPKRHRSNSSASFDRRTSTSGAASSQSALVGMGISMPAAGGQGHSRASSTSVLGPPLERKTPAETLAAASKMRRSNSFMGNNMSLSRRGSETANAPSHARKNSMPMNHVTGQVGSVTSLTSIMTPSLSHTPSASGQVTPNLMTPHTPQFSLDDGEVTPLNSPSAFTGHMMTPGPGPATPMSSQFRDRSFSQSSLYGPIAEDHTLENPGSNGQPMSSGSNNNHPMQFGNPVEFDMGGGIGNGGHGNGNGASNGMGFGINGVAGSSRDSSVYTTNSTGFSQSQGSGSFTSLSTSVDSMSAVSMVMPDSTPVFTPTMDDATVASGDTEGKRISVVKEEDDPYFQFVLSSMFPQDQAQDNDEFYNTMMGIS